MNLRLHAAALSLMVLLALAAAAAAARADIANQKEVVQGMAFYLGIVPSELVRGDPSGHGERDMHGGAPAPGQFYVRVAIFDAASGKRITDARVTARVESRGVSGKDRALEPMLIVDALAYGNFFAIPAKGPFAVVLHVSRPGLLRPVQVRFAHSHR